MYPKADLRKCRRDDLRRDERAVDEIPLGAVVILVEGAQRRQEDAAAQDEGGVDLKVDEGGFELDLFGAVLEFEF